jgi:hypothetical protein
VRNTFPALHATVLIEAQPEPFEHDARPRGGHQRGRWPTPIAKSMPDLGLRYVNHSGRMDCDRFRRSAGASELGSYLAFCKVPAGEPCWKPVPGPCGLRLLGPDLGRAWRGAMKDPGSADRARIRKAIFVDDSPRRSIQFESCPRVHPHPPRFRCSGSKPTIPILSTISSSVSS